MSLLWDGLKEAANRAGNAAGLAAQRAKVKAELLLLEREITGRRQTFGVELYDYAAPRLSAHPQILYASDDTLVATLRPAFISAQREIAALEIRERKMQEVIEQAAVRRGNVITPAHSWQQKVVNAGKSTALAGNEAKLGTELRMIRTQMTHHKHLFGLSLYETLEEMEDQKKWLPTDREIRSIYDSCRRDVDKIKQRQVDKQKELKKLEALSFWAKGDGSGDAYVAPQTNSNNMTLSALGGLGTEEVTVHARAGIVTPDPMPSLNTQGFPSDLPPPNAQPQGGPHASQMPSSSLPQLHSHAYNAPAPAPAPLGYTAHTSMDPAAPGTLPNAPLGQAPPPTASLDPTGFMDHFQRTTPQPSQPIPPSANLLNMSQPAHPQMVPQAVATASHDPFSMLSQAPSPALPLSDVTNAASASVSTTSTSSSTLLGSATAQSQSQQGGLPLPSMNGVKKEVGMYMLRQGLNTPSVWGQ